MAACSAVAAISVALLMEPLFPLGDWRWGVAAAISMLPPLFLYRREIWVHLSRIWKKSPRESGIFAAVAFEPVTANAHVNKRNQNSKERATFTLAELILALIGGAIYYLAFVHEFTETVWTHPTLSNT